MNFAALSVHVPGATIALDGDYRLPDQQLNLHGTASLDARLSQSRTGFKSFLLKALDPIFQKGGAVIPIRVTGTESSPSFGLDLRHK